MNIEYVTSFITSGGVFLWGLFKTWISLFLAPLYPTFTPDLLWIIVPIWLNFLVVELYEERHGTRYGTVIQNGLVAGIIGVDWMRTIVRAMISNGSPVTSLFSIKFGVALLVFSYGAAVVYCGIRAKPLTRRIGRVRAVTYILAVFTPAMYGIVPLTTTFFLSILIYYPIFHLLVNLIDKKAPGTPAHNQ